MPDVSEIPVGDEQLSDNGPVTGHEAEEIYTKLSEFKSEDGNYPEPFVTGYFQSLNKLGEKVFTCFDNLTGEFFVRETKHEKIAQLWISGEIDDIESEGDEVPEYVQLSIMYRDGGNWKTFNDYTLSNKKGYPKAVIEHVVNMLENDPLIANYYGLPNQAPYDNEFIPCPGDDHSFQEIGMHPNEPYPNKGDDGYDIADCIEAFFDPEIVKRKTEEAMEEALKGTKDLAVYLKKLKKSKTPEDPFGPEPDSEPSSADKTQEHLMWSVLHQIEKDINGSRDYTALEELLGFVPIKNLINYLPEEQHKLYASLLNPNQE
jgi:hypothetical protein